MPPMSARVMDEIIDADGARDEGEGAPYKGVLYAGLMITPTGRS